MLIRFGTVLLTLFNNFGDNNTTSLQKLLSNVSFVGCKPGDIKKDNSMKVNSAKDKKGGGMLGMKRKDNAAMMKSSHQDQTTKKHMADIKKKMKEDDGKYKKEDDGKYKENCPPKHPNYSGAAAYPVGAYKGPQRPGAGADPCTSTGASTSAKLHTSLKDFESDEKEYTSEIECEVKDDKYLKCETKDSKKITFIDSIKVFQKGEKRKPKSAVGGSKSGSSKKDGESSSSEEEDEKDKKKSGLKKGGPKIGFMALDSKKAQSSSQPKKQGGNNIKKSMAKDDDSDSDSDSGDKDKKSGGAAATKKDSEDEWTEKLVRDVPSVVYKPTGYKAKCSSSTGISDPYHTTGVGATTAAAAADNKDAGKGKSKPFEFDEFWIDLGKIVDREYSRLEFVLVDTKGKKYLARSSQLKLNEDGEFKKDDGNWYSSGWFIVLIVILALIVIALIIWAIAAASPGPSTNTHTPETHEPVHNNTTA